MNNKCETIIELSKNTQKSCGRLGVEYRVEGALTSTLKPVVHCPMHAKMAVEQGFTLVPLDGSRPVLVTEPALQEPDSSGQLDLPFDPTNSRTQPKVDGRRAA